MTPRSPGPRGLDRSVRVPLWRQLQDDLVRRIEGGEFPDTFPGELELMESYGVSRHTVREAVGRLRRDGVIQSSRGRSSVVAPGMIAQDLGVMYSLFHELEDRGIEQRSEVLVLDVRRDSVVADRMGLPAETGLVYVERIRLGDDEPIAWDCAWLDPELAAPLLDADLSHTALYDEWQRVAGVRLTGGEETIRAIVPTAGQRARLAMRDDEAALRIERTGSVGGRCAEFRRTLVRGSRFSFTARWSSSRAYQVDVAGEG
ncbi:GntR family transcriptional regulator [Nocardioides rotundus]|uniref:GntR family transcriptional regulator n=1 Tax=Nocardioides rotundus TaxID=1774216 RepID=UPI001CBFC80F|nr:GntR family transcriptional regulator [Nocardioides rotundus]UAL29598.1 GntR family transcriptional regulator [Nocardioides rotundus]